MYPDRQSEFDFIFGVLSLLVEMLAVGIAMVAWELGGRRWRLFRDDYHPFS